MSYGATVGASAANSNLIELKKIMNLNCMFVVVDILEFTSVQNQNL